MVHAYSGFENKIAAAIREQADQKGLAEQFDEVLVPTEEVVEVRRGQKVNSERKFFPGYVLVKMDMTDETWHLVKNTPKVTGFLGGQRQPAPITEAEASRILNQVQEGVERPKPAVAFEIGEQVRVADGPFTSFNGTVEEVDEERGRVKVASRSSAARPRSNSNTPRSRRSEADATEGPRARRFRSDRLGHAPGHPPCGPPAPGCARPGPR